MWRKWEGSDTVCGAERDVLTKDKSGDARLRICRRKGKPVFPPASKQLMHICAPSILPLCRPRICRSADNDCSSETAVQSSR